ncbi:MAG: biotin carboxylase, partial [Methylobacterium sp.]|nr:biotin carboxylase [Methylobacterium sp.]
DFDPMLAKLVSHGPDRETAINRMVEALKQLTLLGVTTNIDYLIRVLDHPAFRAGDLHTGFVSAHGAALALPPTGRQARDHAAILAALGCREFAELVFATPEPYASMGFWRN